MNRSWGIAAALCVGLLVIISVDWGGSETETETETEILTETVPAPRVETTETEEEPEPKREAKPEPEPSEEEVGAAVLPLWVKTRDDKFVAEFCENREVLGEDLARSTWESGWEETDVPGVTGGEAFDALSERC